jgi:aspartyl-tRNA(Asn)/glutamyl-tRNA(Gln) amidotransferase subunit C
MAISKETVQYVADLSRLELNPGELEKLSTQLQAILGFIDQLSEVDISGTAPTSHILPINNVLREDSPRISLPVEKVLLNAPQKKDDFFVVPKVIE